MSLIPFRARIRRSIADLNLQAALDGNAMRRTNGRLAAFASLPDHQERRQRAHAIKAEVVAHLEEYLDRFIARLQENGITVHRAADAQEALRIVQAIAAASDRKAATLRPRSGERVLLAKSKSMVSEEIGFNHAMQAAGFEVVETDLGEYIVQLRGERPSHLITPAVHLRRGDVARLFEEKLGLPYTEDIPVLTATARRVLRDVFLSADVGISGVNFGVAATGTLCLVTNEGNGRMCTTLPPVHIALMGLERLVPTLDDLALFLSLLPRSATGQKLSVYTSLIHAPRRPGEVDGPQERHLVLVDNGRLRMSRSNLAEALACIRCGACLNACPVFRELSGHAYLGRDGSIAPYPGPIGSVVSPGLAGCENYGHLAQASSLCGACKEACPVDIDLPGMLLRIRAGEAGTGERVAAGVGLPGTVKLGLRGFGLAARQPWLFGLGQRLGGIFTRLVSPRRAYMRLPAFTGWGLSKDFPRLEPRPFRSRWQGIHQDVLPVDGKTSPAPAQQPVAPTSGESLPERFRRELEAVGGKVSRMRQEEVPVRLRELLREKGLDRVQADRTAAAYLEGIASGLQPDPDIRLGVTGALCGIAENGSLVLTGSPDSPLTASLVPETHIALLPESALVATLEEALRGPEVRQASAAAIVTGPSRTADIEMTLTIGVHGPGELHVFLIDDL
jgi:L-lactate dehydrogenase complex protein LldF